REPVIHAGLSQLLPATHQVWQEIAEDDKGERDDHPPLYFHTTTLFRSRRGNGHRRRRVSAAGLGFDDHAGEIVPGGHSAGVFGHDGQGVAGGQGRQQETARGGERGGEVPAAG